MVTIEELTREAEWLRRGQAVWEEYQRAHDVTGQDGQTVGIDLDTGAVHIGQSEEAVAALMADGGYKRRIWFDRIGVRRMRHHTRLRRL